MRKLFPQHGQAHSGVMDALRKMKLGDSDWQNGRVPLYVFDGGQDVFDIGRDAYFEFFKENALGGRRAFPSVLQMEMDVIDMGLDLLKGPDSACGFMTTGGTESIIMAVQTARNHARSSRDEPRLRGNLVVAETAHPAFDKAARLMDLEVRRTPVRDDLRADAAAFEAALDADTIMIVGSAPCFPYGVIDPIAELSKLALRRKLWLHVDACVGGYIAPFAAMLQRDIPAFDFGVPGVSSMSADLHKFGFCPKPASTVYYRDADLAVHHGFEFDAWPSGTFMTNTICGTRPAGGVAGAWAVFQYLGLEGYQRVAGEVMGFVDEYKRRISAIDGLRIVGDPHLSIVAYTSDTFDIFAVAEELKARGWVPGLLQKPRAIHQMLSLVQARALNDYIADVTEAVAVVRASPAKKSDITASY